MAKQPSADRLREFHEVAKRGSISAAARYLSIPRATLSRRMTGLEVELGVRLFQRTTRNVQLTSLGEELFVRASRLVAETDAAWAALRRHDGVPQGSLRVAVPDSAMAGSPFFVDYCLAFPDVTLDVVAVEKAIDMRRDGFDVALHFGDVEDGSLIAKRLWQGPMLVVASRRYVEAHGLPKELGEVSEHRVVLFSREEVPRHVWPLHDGTTVAIQPTLTTNAFLLALEAIRRGVGLGLLPRHAVRSELESGELVPILEDVVGFRDSFSVLFVEREFLLPHVREFIDRAALYWKQWNAQWEPGQEQWGPDRPTR